MPNARPHPPSTPVEKVLRPDSKGRVTLGAYADGVSSFKVTERQDGALILEPQVEVPKREAWLYANSTALKAVRKGLAESAAGRVASLGSFAKHADDDID